MFKNKLIFKTRSGLASLALAAALASPVQAQSLGGPVTWNIGGATGDGGSLIGQFVQDIYDYQSGAFSFSVNGATFGAVLFDNSTILSLNTSSTSLSVGNKAGYGLTLNFAHDLLNATRNEFTGVESFNGVNVAVSGVALAVPAPVAGGGAASLLALIPLLWLERRRSRRA